MGNTDSLLNILPKIDYTKFEELRDPAHHRLALNLLTEAIDLVRFQRYETNYLCTILWTVGERMKAEDHRRPWIARVLREAIDNALTRNTDKKETYREWWVSIAGVMGYLAGELLGSEKAAKIYNESDVVAMSNSTLNDCLRVVFPDITSSNKMQLLANELRLNWLSQMYCSLQELQVS